MNKDGCQIDFSILKPDDRCLTDVWRLNETYATILSSMTCSELSDIIANSAIAICVSQNQQCVGFIIALTEEADYSSENYRWFQRRYDSFLYIDRVVVHPQWQGRSIARTLYSAVAKHAQTMNRNLICCEVSSVPQNLPSMRFHDALGFVVCGTRQYAQVEKEVVMLIHTQPEKLATSIIHVM